MISIPDLPYYKIFTPDEREAAKASIEYRCDLCNEVVFYSDLWNIRDHFPMTICCRTCRSKNVASFNAKREKYFDKTKTTDKQKL